MGKDTVWAGGIELHALAMELSFNVVVHSVGNKRVEHLIHRPVDRFPVCHLSLHVGDHYNSIRRADDKMLRFHVPINQFPIGYDLEKVKKFLKGKKLHFGCRPAPEPVGGADNPWFREDDKPSLLGYALSKVDKVVETRDEEQDEADRVVMTKVLQELIGKSDLEFKRVDHDFIDANVKELRRLYRQ